jgi:hypothetical protein
VRTFIDQGSGVTRGPRPSGEAAPFPYSAFVSRSAFVQIFVKRG